MASATTARPDVFTTAFQDGPSLDSFSRLRVSTPAHVFDAQLTYDLAPLRFEQITNGSGATVAHDATNRCATMTFSSTASGGKAYMQSHEYFPYQPGRSQLAFVTFNFIEPKANVLKFAGYSDGVNGVELQQSGSDVQLVLYSGTANGTQTVAQADWNLDALTGHGPSNKTLDLTKTQILVIDFQALYVGRVRVGFDIDGVVCPVHEFKHANRVATPYAQTMNLPVRCGMTCTGTASTTMRFICSSVMSEGGNDQNIGTLQTVEGSGTAGNNVRAHILSVRPKTTFNSIANRSRFVLESIELLNTGNVNNVYWEVVIGQAITGTTTFSDVNTAYSAFEYNTAGTISGSPALSILSGYAIPSNKGANPTIVASSALRTPISLNQAGAVRANGTISVVATGIGGTSAVRACMNWREQR